MDAREQIDIDFDFRTDTPPGKDRDPDALSPTLRRYHKFLWSKPLPCGEVLDLDDTAHGHYLLHRPDELREFSLSSDAVVASFRYLPMVQDEPEQLEEFMHIGYTIGGMMLWPGNQVDGKMTINGARGCHPRIRDRFDLTVECIRRHYVGEDSPLREVLERYADFFKLFVNFRGFVEFFLLQDAATVDCDAVIFCAPLRGFSTSSAIPETMEEYQEYRQRAMAFIEARNLRIAEYCRLRALEDRSLGVAVPPVSYLLRRDERGRGCSGADQLRRGKRPANERSVTRRPSLSLADTPALIPTLRTALSGTSRYLLTL